MTDKLYQVFISSTYDDLREERKAAATALAKAGFFVSGMELFPATSVSQLSYIKRMIDRCDYYVLIIAGRYGTIGENGISFTEEEYNYATSKNKPVLAFIHEDVESIEKRKIDVDLDKRILLDSFKKSALNGRIVEFWKTPTELAMKIALALQQETNLNPQIGWVRGDKAASIEIYEEIERLRSENKRLIEKIRIVSEVDGDTVKMTEEIAIEITIICYFTDNKLSSIPTGTVKNTRSEILPLNDIYAELFERFSRQITLEEKISKTIVAEEHGSKYVIPPQGTYLINYVEQIDNMEVVRLHFAATGMIDLVSNRDSFNYGSNSFSWDVTEKGRRYGYNLLARRLAG